MSQGRSGRVQKVSPPLRFDPGDQPVTSCCTGYAISTHLRVFCTEVECSLTEKLQIVRLCCPHSVKDILKLRWIQMTKLLTVKFSAVPCYLLPFRC